MRYFFLILTLSQECVEEKNLFILTAKGIKFLNYAMPEIIEALSINKVLHLFYMK